MSRCWDWYTWCCRLVGGDKRCGNGESGSNIDTSPSITPRTKLVPQAKKLNERQHKRSLRLKTNFIYITRLSPSLHVRACWKRACYNYVSFQLRENPPGLMIGPPPMGGLALLPTTPPGWSAFGSSSPLIRQIALWRHMGLIRDHPPPLSKQPPIFPLSEKKTSNLPDNHTHRAKCPPKMSWSLSSARRKSDEPFVVNISIF